MECLQTDYSITEFFLVQIVTLFGAVVSWATAKHPSNEAHQYEHICPNSLQTWPMPTRILYKLCLLHWFSIFVQSVVLPISKSNKLLANTPETIPLAFVEQTSLSLGLSIMLLISGLNLILSGYAAMILIQFISGVYAFGIMALFTCNTLGQRQLISFGTNKDLITMISIIVLGIIGGLLAFKFDFLGTFLLGALFGFCIAVILVQFRPIESALSNRISRLIYIGVLTAITGGIVVYSESKQLIIAASSFVGAFAVVLAIDYFIASQFGDFVYNAVYLFPVDPLRTKTQISLGIFAALMAVGTGIQIMNTRK